MARSAWECLYGRSASGSVLSLVFDFRLVARLSPFTASQGGPLARPPLAIPPGTRLHGPSGSLRCSAWRGPAELVAALLRHAAVLFPASPVLLARVNGTNPGCTLHLRVVIAPTLRRGSACQALCVRFVYAHGSLFRARRRVFRSIAIGRPNNNKRPIPVYCCA